MEHVTDRRSNPFGMSAPSEPAVYGYGDVNADVHVIGADPATHGGRETGVPFTGSVAGYRLQGVLAAVGLADEPYSDAPTYRNCYVSYRWLCDDGEALERFCDAELRAINAHLLLPVGDRATAYVLETHTTQAHRLPADAAALHAEAIRGRGFLVVPIREPTEWTDEDCETLVDDLATLLASDYRQTKGVATTVG